MKIFGYTIVTVEFLRQQDAALLLSEKNLSLQESINKELINQNIVLRKKVDEKKLDERISIDVGDPTPQNLSERKEYISRVASFYRDIFKAKCVQMISAFHSLLENEENSDRTNLYLQIGVYLCRDFMKWGEAANNEFISYGIEPPPSSKDVEIII